MTSQLDLHQGRGTEERLLLCAQNHPCRDYVSIANRTLAAYLSTRFDSRQVAARVLDFQGEDDVDSMLQAIVAERPDIVGLSIYIWNYQKQFELAQRLKDALTDTILILGGPHLGGDEDQRKELSELLPRVDVFVVGEGELALESYLNASPAERPCGGVWIMGESLPDLGCLPAPLFDLYPPQIMPAFHLIETTRGCPNGCAYCLFPGFGPRRRTKRRGQILAELRDAVKRGIPSVIYCEPSINLHTRHFANIIGAIHEAGVAKSLVHQITADYMTLRDDQIDQLADLNVELSLGLQSINPVAVRIAKRRFDLQRFKDVVQKLNARGLRASVDVIFGLPGETLESFTQGLEFLAALPVDPRFFLLRVLPGSAFYRDREDLGLEVDRVNGYAVRSTREMNQDDFSVARERLAVRGWALVEQILADQSILLAQKASPDGRAGQNRQTAQKEITRLFRLSLHFFESASTLATITGRRVENWSGVPALVLDVSFTMGGACELAFLPPHSSIQGILKTNDVLVVLRSESAQTPIGLERLMEQLDLFVKRSNEKQGSR
jgi:radical SAM superfamily enzyme YgiQ (UPF0313 family)